MTASPDYEYVNGRIRGLAAYADFCFRDNLSVEIEFHQLNDPASAVYQRTYELGGRYMRHYGNFIPYAKGLCGRGVLNFPDNQANLAYNLFAAGAGVDYAIHPRINLRADLEYQYWMSAPGPGLHLAPNLFMIGAAYHFGPGSPR
jgi:hypothetical protein